MVLATADVGSPAAPVPAVVVERAGHLYAIAVDGSRRVRLRDVPGRDPSLSPDGRTFAYTRERGGISTVRLDGSDRRIVTRGDDSDAAWTADGTTLYFSRGEVRFGGETCGSIFAVASSGGAVNQITDTSGTRHSHRNPSVSPDGRAIAFSDWDACAGGTSSPRLRVVDVHGRTTGDLARLTHDGYYPDPEHSCPAWSPDGRQIAYRWNTDLAVANRDGTGERRIVPGYRFLIYEPPVWSSDGRWIAFTRTNPAVVIVVHPDGTGLRRIARAGSDDYSLVGWLPSLPK